MNGFFSSLPLLETKGIAIVRIIFSLLLVYHGLEVFDPALMNGYAEWDLFKGPAAKLIVYAGKSFELVAGIFLLLGLFTRPSSILVIATFIYITFFIGKGKFWYEDQHPFMFVLFGLLFVFTGPGAWSLDALIFKKKD
jgi:putative oxidoreductase